MTLGGEISSPNGTTQMGNYPGAKAPSTGRVDTATIAVGILATITIVGLILGAAICAKRREEKNNPEAKRRRKRCIRLRAAWQILLYARLGEAERGELDGLAISRQELEGAEGAKELHEGDFRCELECFEKRAELQALEAQCLARKIELRELEDGTWEWDAGSRRRLSEMPCRCSTISSFSSLRNGEPG